MKLNRIAAKHALQALFAMELTLKHLKIVPQDLSALLVPDTAKSFCVRLAPSLLEVLQAKQNALFAAQALIVNIQGEQAMAHRFLQGIMDLSQDKLCRTRTSVQSLLIALREHLYLSPVLMELGLLGNLQLALLIVCLVRGVLSADMRRCTQSDLQLSSQQVPEAMPILQLFWEEQSLASTLDPVLVVTSVLKVQAHPCQPMDALVSLAQQERTAVVLEELQAQFPVQLASGPRLNSLQAVPLAQLEHIVQTLAQKQQLPVQQVSIVKEEAQLPPLVLRELIILILEERALLLALFVTQDFSVIAQAYQPFQDLVQPALFVLGELQQLLLGLPHTHLVMFRMDFVLKVDIARKELLLHSLVLLDPTCLPQEHHNALPVIQAAIVP
jgi:hypothetical protein